MRVRRVLCEAAQTAKRHPDFAPGYEAIAHRRGKKMATTAIARKLVGAEYRVTCEKLVDVGASLTTWPC